MNGCICPYASLVLTATLSCMDADLEYTDLGLRQCFFVAVFQSHMGSLNLLGRLYKSVVHWSSINTWLSNSTSSYCTCCLLRLAHACMHGDEAFVLLKQWVYAARELLMSACMSFYNSCRTRHRMLLYRLFSWYRFYDDSFTHMKTKLNWFG